MAKQLGVDRSKLNADTSLGELGADDLDLVELVMELEEHFDITIPDDAFEPTLGTDKGQGQLRNVTLAKLAALVAERTGRNAQGVQGPAPATGAVSGERKSPSIR